MAKQEQVLHQTEEQRQLQRLTPQQYLVARLVELPITDLERRVQDEVYENVALEEGRKDESEDYDASDSGDDVQTDEYNSDAEDSESFEPDDRPVENSDDYSGDEDLPTYPSGTSSGSEETERPIGDSQSFIDELEAQVAEYDVTDRQHELVNYLIGSLDERGFLDRSLRGISDDLLFNHNIDASVDELEAALHLLQQFDPAGVGARDLRECLLLQVERQLSQLPAEKDMQGDTDLHRHLRSRKDLLELEHRILSEGYKAFEKNDTARLAELLSVTPERIHAALQAIGKLNPHPGRSLHESATDRVQTVVPDFIIETDRESSVNFWLNNGEVPPLHISDDYQRQLKAYQRIETKLSRSQREAYIYTKQKVESAQMFIAAIQQRQRTLTETMKAIVALQRDFMLTQDEAVLHPLRLTDVAERTGLDISTISRVVNSKYALLDGVLYSLKYFFLRAKQNAQGKEILRTKVLPLLRELIDGEDKSNPLSDAQLSELMAQHGEAISRRTVSKYRDELKIPSAAMRKRM